MGKTVFITGVAGFLGSHLASHHLSLGDRVWGVDNFCSSRSDSDHLKRLRLQMGFTFIEHDVCDPYRESSDIDVTYNMACPASPPIYQRMPIETMMTCTLGTKNVLELAHDHGSVIVHASTSEVYGNPTSHPQKESDWGNVHSYGPRSCYDEGKRAAEALCFDYLNKHSVDVRLARVFNTYGPHMDPRDGRVVSNFICQALRNEPLTVYGDGSQTRSLCYVDDLIRGIVALGELKENPRTPVNLGNPNEMTILEIGLEVIKRLGGSISKGPLPIDDPERRCPDISLAKRLLGWEPTTSLNVGLEKTVEHFRRMHG